jgi:hypothetical protein
LTPSERSARWLDLLFSAAVVMAIAAPMLFTRSGFELDFTNHLWLVWAAGKALVQSGHPSYFLNTRGAGAFYPWFAFYGGPLYMLAGGISELLGDPIAAYLGVSTIAIAACYGATVWLGRQLGLGRAISHAPALTVVTSAYFITNLYGRGAWPELIATAAIAPLLASGLWLARAQAWRPLPVLVFVLSIATFTGSHNITLAWGTLALLLVAAALWLAFGAPRRMPTRRIVMVAGLALLGVAANAWYLVPDLLYARDVAAHLELAVGGAGAPFFDTPGVLFDPLRTVPAESSTAALYVQVPDWFLAWSVAAGVVLLTRRGASRELRRGWIGLAGALILLLALIMVTPIWRMMPYPFDEIQFPYRISSYVVYVIGGLVLVSGLALQRRAAGGPAGRAQRLLEAGLVAACLISIALCVWQQWVPKAMRPGRSYSNRAEALVSPSALPRTWYDPGSYVDTKAPVVRAAYNRILFIRPGQVHGDRYSATLDVPPGLAPIQTNITGGGYLVHVAGVEQVGRNEEGLMVVRRERAGSGPLHVTIETTHSAALVSSWIVSVIASLAILSILAWTAAHRFRSRQAAT